ncbi:MAG: trk system potassium uptake protein TrkH [Pirellulaceae bacterium]|jgi:trk system potassium uptake protein TrkH
MTNVTGSIASHPARLSFVWYALVIVIGAAMLTLPVSRTSTADPISTLDAAFTATSATCVTGLAVRSTGGDFSLFGQIVILVLIQLGGIGIMTVTTIVSFGFGMRQGLRQRTLIADTLGGDELDLRWVLWRVVRWTLMFELLGFVLLFTRFVFEQSVPDALWHAFFHSISAFCNAGFSLNDDSLTRYQGDWLVNLTVFMLVICGGIGFPVMADIVRNWHGPYRDRWDRLMLHTKLMLIGSIVLLAIGTVAFFLLEHDGVLKDMPFGRKVLAAAFHSVSTRTAGFNTVDLAQLSSASLLITMILMLIGAGPCSTGGGFKVTTFFVVLLRGWATFRNQSRLTIFRRCIPTSAIERATATALLFAAIATVALITLLACEQSSAVHEAPGNLFVHSSFEVASALGTVGLSTGMTARLSTAGRIIVIVLMFFGRLGPITVFAALSREDEETGVEYLEEQPLVG